eukprot:Pgem_evm1s17621
MQTADERRVAQLAEKQKESTERAIMTNIRVFGSAVDAIMIYFSEPHDVTSREYQPTVVK